MTEFRVGRIYTKRDDDAVLADKQTMRVPTMMRDGKTCDVRAVGALGNIWMKV